MSGGARRCVPAPVRRRSPVPGVTRALCANTPEFAGNGRILLDLRPMPGWAIDGVHSHAWRNRHHDPGRLLRTGREGTWSWTL
jgi:hypothetical protein